MDQQFPLSNLAEVLHPLPRLARLTLKQEPLSWDASLRPLLQLPSSLRALFISTASLIGRGEEEDFLLPFHFSFRAADGSEESEDAEDGEEDAEFASDQSDQSDSSEGDSFPSSASSSANLRLRLSSLVQPSVR